MTAGGREEDLDQALALCRRGRVVEALDALRTLADRPSARALLALLENRAADALDAALVADDRSADALRYRALAAWRCGDAIRLVDAVSGLAEVAPVDRDLQAMAAVARAARGGRLRQVRADEPLPAMFDTTAGLPAIDVRSGSLRGAFIFDTGAEVSVIDPAAAAGWPVRAVAPVDVYGNAGEVTGSLGILDELVALGCRLAEVPVVVADLAGIRARMSGVVGILSPLDVFGRAVLGLDLGAGTVERRRESAADGEPFVCIGGRAVIGIGGRLDDAPTGLFAIDTGARRSAVTLEYVEQWSAARPDLALTPATTVAIDAVGAAARPRRSVPSSRFIATTFRVDLRDVVVDTTSADVRSGRMGKLGTDAFARRTLEIDGTTCRVRLS